MNSAGHLMESTLPCSLCQSCDWMREIRSAKGSRFLLCRLSQTDPRFVKYPAQPVVQCAGYVARDESK